MQTIERSEFKEVGLGERPKQLFIDTIMIAHEENSEHDVLFGLMASEMQLGEDDLSSLRTDFLESHSFTLFGPVIQHIEHARHALLSDGTLVSYRCLISAYIPFTVQQRRDWEQTLSRGAYQTLFDGLRCTLIREKTIPAMHSEHGAANPQDWTMTTTVIVSSTHWSTLTPTVCLNNLPFPKPPHWCVLGSDHNFFQLHS